jgi:uncharacterized protein YndB with AHSA1/START domain
MSAQDDEGEIGLVRRTDAPIEAVFAAFTDGTQLQDWWGPQGFEVPSARIDPRLGGEIQIVMRAPDATDTPSEGTYREFTAPDHLVMDLTAYRPDGLALLWAEITVDLRDDAGTTEIRIRSFGRVLEAEARPMLTGMEEGWNETLDRLEGYLEGAGGATIKMRHDTV